MTSYDNGRWYDVTDMRYILVAGHYVPDDVVSLPFSKSSGMADVVCVDLNAGSQAWSSFNASRGPQGSDAVCILDTDGWAHVIARADHFRSAAHVAAYTISGNDPIPSLGIAQDLVRIWKGELALDKNFSLTSAAFSKGWVIGYAADLRTNLDRHTVAAKAPEASMWNGTCTRCGDRTYTGLFEVKHERGSCR